MMDAYPSASSVDTDNAPFATNLIIPYLAEAEESGFVEDDVIPPSSYFDDLPNEVLRSILSYMDIPSLAALSNSHKARDGNMSHLAADDTTWYTLVRNRFGIGRDNRRRRQGEGVVVMKKGGDGQGPASYPLNLHGSLSHLLLKKSSQSEYDCVPRPIHHGGRRRPASYGGRDWKSAYRSLSETMRIPETYLTGSGPGGVAVFASTKKSVSNGQDVASYYLGVWCMVNHTEDCHTKTVIGGRWRTKRHRGVMDGRGPITVNDNNLSPPLPYRTDRRYIELKICLQNTKSGYGQVVIPDVRSIQITSFHEEKYFDSLGDGWNDCRVGGHEMTFEIVKEGPWSPRIALRRRVYNDACDDMQDGWEDPNDNKNDDKMLTSLILCPFEVVIMSVHVSCPESHTYETDTLSCMSSVRVPIVADGWPTTNTIGKGSMEKGRCSCDSGGGVYGGIGHDWNMKKRDVSIARFLPEDDLWEYYCLLPGGCMSLTDRSRLVPM